MTVRCARAEEAGVISALALRSKGFWGYSPEFLEQCRSELTSSPDRIAALRAHVADVGGTVVGFFTIQGLPPEGELESLYVDPTAMGQGVGRALLRAAMALAQTEGFHALAIHADPHAEAFYLRHGATRIGEVPSGSIPGRVLPLLRLGIE